MLATKTKAQKQPAGWEAEQTRLNELESELRELNEKIENCRFSDPRVNSVMAGEEPGETVQQMAQRRVILEKAVDSQRQRVNQAMFAVGRKKYDARKTEHNDLVADIVQAVENLQTALQAEKDFRGEFAGFGMTPPSMNFGEYPWLDKIRNIDLDSFRRRQRDRGFNLKGKK